jgi:large conductance mechanosensitive channel
VIAYGAFLNDVINFLIIAFVVFMLVKTVNRIKREPPEAPAVPTTRDCPYCLLAIPLKATRCAHCTADVKP